MEKGGEGQRKRARGTEKRDRATGTGRGKHTEMRKAVGQKQADVVGG